jgi:putative membrane protein
MHYLAMLPQFVLWFSVAFGMLTLFVMLYNWLTPWHDVALIRQGNVAAACSFSGAMLGYAIVLASIISGATSRGDLLSWGVVGVVVQLLAYGVGRLMLGPGLRARMEAGDLASGVLLGALALAAGIINAATMLY